MKTSFALLLAVAAVTLICAPGVQAASFERCGSFNPYGSDRAKYKAKNMSCRAAKRVLRNAGMSLCFDNQIPGWTKVWRALPNGGKALTLKKGAKAIRTNACSPR